MYLVEGGAIKRQLLTVQKEVGGVGGGLLLVSCSFTGDDERVLTLP